jgi:hypothetical protein
LLTSQSRVSEGFAVGQTSSTNGNHPGETKPALSCRRCPSHRRPRPPTFERLVRSDGHAIRDTFEGISQPLRMNRRTDDDTGDYSLSREILPSGRRCCRQLSPLPPQRWSTHGRPPKYEVAEVGRFDTKMRLEGMIGLLQQPRRTTAGAKMMEIPLVRPNEIGVGSCWR